MIDKLEKQSGVLLKSTGLFPDELEIKEPKLTFKQKKFLKLYFETGNATKAALQSYETDDPKTASVIAAENLAKLRNPIKTWLEMNGLSLKHLMGVLVEGLRATKIKTSMTEPDREVPDHPTRHKYLETAARWLGVEDQQSQDQQVKRRLTVEEFFQEEK